MRCGKYGQEMKEEKDFLTREFCGLEVTKVMYHRIAFKDIVIPRGYRLLTLIEGADLLNNDEFVEWIDFKNEQNDFYIKQPFKQNEGKYAAWLGCNSQYFDLGTYDFLDSNVAARGVIFVKE